VTKKEKLEAKIRNNPRNVSLEDFESLIKQYGEIFGGGSHSKAYINNHVYPYKKENPVKAHYVESVLKFIDELKGE
jgi:hypothetical protein